MKYIAGIVLYNPDLGRLKENIESICKQVDKVILIDNGSDNIREIEDLIKEYLNCILLKRRKYGNCICIESNFKVCI